MSTGGVKVDPNDPNVRRLVYNMYRGILGQYNDKANTIVNSLPRHVVKEDQGITRQIESMILNVTCRMESSKAMRTAGRVASEEFSISHAYIHSRSRETHKSASGECRSRSEALRSACMQCASAVSGTFGDYVDNSVKFQHYTLLPLFCGVIIHRVPKKTEQLY
ncbi:hypothetical protein J6590_027887 [Homalodisca vitripennis]|nr:hypothetical protein J6590_027887 [Homalodisca vitripennis]